MTFLYAGVLLVLFTLYKLITSFNQRRNFNRFAKEHGCAEPLDLTEPWYHRPALVWRMLKSEKSGEDFLEDVIAENFKHASTVKRAVLQDGAHIFTIAPENMKAMLATQFKDYTTGDLRARQFGPVLGKSIFSSHGTFWEHSRALFRPQFSRENINDLESEKKAVDNLIAAIGPTDNEGWTGDVKLLPLLFNLTMDTASEFLFGHSLETQKAFIPGSKPGTGEGVGLHLTTDQFTKDFTMISDQLLKRVRLLKLYWIADGFKFRAAMKRTHHFIEGFVSSAVNDFAGEKAIKKSSLLASLTSQTKDQAELRDQTLAALFAGRDTTASLLGWCFQWLSLYPDIYEKLRGVVLRDFPPGQDIDFARLKGCRYLQHFINEVLRLHPTVPINYRFAAHDTTLPVGGGPDGKSPVAVSAGQIIVYSVYLMQRDKAIWGDDALEFKPERWEQKISAWQFIPFSGGPRICIGQQFALTEASYVLVRLLTEFDRVEPVSPAEMRLMKKAMGLTMWPADDVKIRLRKAPVMV